MAGLPTGVRAVRPVGDNGGSHRIDDRTGVGTGDTEDRGTTGGAARPARSRRRMLVIGSTAVAAVLAVVAGVLGAMLASGGAEEQTRADVLAATTTQLQTLLSYDGNKLDAAARVVDEATTGSFHDDYERLFDESVRPNAERLEARTLARVVGAAWIGSEGGDAKVLAFVNQSTTTDRGERVDTVAATVTMREVDGRWLIAGLDQA